MSKSKAIEVRCPKCGTPVIGKVGDRCLCGAPLHSNVVFIR